MTHDEIIAALEKATGPDRELDDLLLAARGTHVFEKRGRDRKAWWYQVDKEYVRLDPDGFGVFGVPNFTASIDAALTLVPEGWDVDLEIRQSWSHAFMENDKGTEAASNNVPTPALAICIAALRAHGGSHG